MTSLPPTCAPVPERLAGRTAVVTGGGSGIGRATCLRLAAEGANVLVTDINEASAKETAALLGAQGYAAVLDVSVRCEWQAITKLAVEEFAGLDILVNCAGRLVFGNIEGTSLEDFRRLQAVNLDGPFFGCQATIPTMKKHGGAIVNLCSTSSLRGNPDLFAYDTTKGALHALTKEVATYCGVRGYPIRCNAILPCAVDTPMVANHFDVSTPETVKELVRSQAIKRMAAPEEIAALIAFLVSDDASFATGAGFAIDGGSSAGQPWMFE